MPVNDSAEPQDGVPGWYGKIASLGDFASRRLPTDFVTRLDDWLQRIIAGSRAELGDQWMDVYLTSPVWRFVLFPEAFDEDAWAGLLMPSCDKVGRYFPLCIAALVPHGEPDSRLIRTLDEWQERLESIALRTLDTSASMEEFDDTLARAKLDPSPESAAMKPVVKGVIEALRSGNPALLGASELSAMGEAMAFAGTTLFNEMARGATVWWTAARPDRRMHVLVSRGLPDVAQYVAMLRGGLGS